MKMYLFRNILGVLICVLLQTKPVAAQNPCATEWSIRASHYDGTGTRGLWWCCDSDAPGTCEQSCSPTLENCKYFHLRNLTGGDCPGVIKRIEVQYFFHDGQQKFSFCGGLKNFGISPWTEAWDAEIYYDTYVDNTKSSGDCISTNNETNVTMSFTPPSSTTDYKINPGNHWTVVLCGGEKYIVRVFWEDGTIGGHEYPLGEIQNACNGCPE